MRAIMRRLARNKLSVAGLILFSIIMLIALLAPWIAPYPYAEMNSHRVLEGPSADHWLGTDHLGRDVLSRLMIGARYSLTLGILSVLGANVIGILIGALAGFYGGIREEVIMRILDIVQSIPNTLLTITVATVFGAGFMNTILALSVAFMPNVARGVRSVVISIRNNEYLEAAEASNCSTARKILTHILPNSMSYIIVNFTMMTAFAILLATSLSFIGLGVQPPTPEWGAMLIGARNHIRDHAYLLIFPGICIGLTVLSLNLLGDGLRDAMDPKLRK